MRSNRRTVRIRRFPKRRVYTMSIEEFLANFEPVVQDVDTGERFDVRTSGKEVVVGKFPPCDLHPNAEARYDFSARSMGGRWMYGCDHCFKHLNGRLGLGLGQRLVLRSERKDRPDA